MDINFDTDVIWDIWYYFIVYGTIVIFGLSLFRKFLLYSSLKKSLGNGYKSIPNTSKMPKWRKYLVYSMIFLSFSMILFTILRAESFLFLIPVLFVTGIVYLNGKIKFYFWDNYSTFFYSKKGFCIYPFFNPFSFKLFKWQNVENIKFIDKGSSGKFIIKIKDRKNFVKLVTYKNNVKIIKDLFNEVGQTLS